MRKGFTLVELAIVLVVIGILLGMAIKGRALMDSAQIRSDVNKLQKLASGYAIYYSKNNKAPGKDNKAWSMMDNLTKDGTLSDGDFTSKLGNGYWGLVPCEPSTNGRQWKVSTTVSENICVGLVTTKPIATDDKMLADTNIIGISPQFACYIETMLDNRDVNTGDGRGTTADKPTIATKNATTTSDAWDCSAESAAQDTGSKYLFKIF